MLHKLVLQMVCLLVNTLVSLHWRGGCAWGDGGRKCEGENAVVWEAETVRKGWPCFIHCPYCQPGLAEISFCYSVILFSSKGFAPAVVLVQGKGWQGEGTDPSWHLVSPVLSMVLLNLNLHGLRCSPEAGGHNYHPLHPHTALQSSQQWRLTNMTPRRTLVAVTSQLWRSVTLAPG